MVAPPNTSRSGDRVFYFKDRSGAVREKGAVPAQWEVEKSSRTCRHSKYKPRNGMTFKWPFVFGRRGASEEQ
jgi:hypothetical protein